MKTQNNSSRQLTSWFCGALALLASSASPAASLTESNGGKTVAVARGDNTFHPVYAGGNFLLLRGNRTPSPDLQVVDANGRVLTEVTTRFDGASTVGIRTLAQGNDGTIAIGGYSISFDGRVASFLNITSPSGQTSTVRTDPFAPQSVAISDDAHIWLLGILGRIPGQPADFDPRGGAIREFSPSGKFIRSWFPLSEINDRLRAFDGMLSAKGGRVGWMSSGFFKPGIGYPSGAYVEILADGSTHQYLLPPIGADPGTGKAVSSFTLLPDGNVVAVWGDPAKGAARFSTLQRSGNSWEETPPVNFPAGEFPVILGGDQAGVAVWASRAGRVAMYQVR